MKPNLPLPLTRRLDSHFLTCSAIVAGVSTFTATKADAAVVYSGIVNVPIQPTSVNGGMYFDFETPGVTIQGPKVGFATWDVNPYESGTKIYINKNVRMVATGTTASNLLAGTSIGPASIYNADADVVINTAIPSGTSAYVGFKFTTNNPEGTVGTVPLYGWALMSVTSGSPGTLISYAYETSGAPIAAGAVPEPSSLSMLALGALGLTQLRRRRAA